MGADRAGVSGGRKGMGPALAATAEGHAAGSVGERRSVSSAHSDSWCSPEEAENQPQLRQEFGQAED